MGEYAHTIDAKGRVILPADFRAELGEHFVVTRGLGGNCLFIYGENEWAELEQKLRRLPMTKPGALRLVRHFFSGGRTLECDRQGRFLVPGNLRSYAMLEKDVILVGMPDHIEVWNKTEWEKYNDLGDDGAEQLAEAIEDLGI